jgi:hypothetical protein
MRSAEVAPVLFVAALLFAAIWPLRPADSVTVAARQSATVEWAEAAWVPQDTAPRRLPLSAREQGFARQFPGHIARFADSRHEWIVRVIDKPTRMLHPAADCFRGLGYTVTPPRVHRDARGEHWRCFTATGKGKPLRVCERIFDAQSGRWTDASSWYWSALLTRADHTMGPWWAVTRVEMEE